MTKLKCSLLINIYNGDNPKFFDEAMQSVLAQSVLPNEIVVVVDGPVNQKIETMLMKFEKNKLVRIVRLERNLGAGRARNEGLKACTHDLVAVMDADDIMDTRRIELQLAEFEKDAELILVGGQLAEFVDNDVKKVVLYRKVPLTMADIKKTVRRRSPFNNVTVMYKKTVIMGAGGYAETNRGEDYYLFAKLIKSGCKMRNINETLVYFRLDDEAIRRRKTWQHSKNVIYVKNAIRKLGLCSWFDVLIFSVAQMSLMIMPLWLVKIIYRMTRRG